MTRTTTIPSSSNPPVCGRCREVAAFGWMGGPHGCVVADPDEARLTVTRHRIVEDCHHRHQSTSRRIRLVGEDLAALKRAIEYLLRQADNINEVRVVVNEEGQLFFGANGFVSQSFGAPA